MPVALGHNPLDCGSVQPAVPRRHHPVPALPGSHGPIPDYPLVLTAEAVD